MRTARSNLGISMIEIMVVVAIVAVLAGVAGPNFSTFIKNSQIKNTAESVLSGLQMARMEALRRNTSIRFQLTNNLTSSCVLSTSSANWIINFDSDGNGGSNSVNNACNVVLFNAAFPTTDTVNNPAPQILKKHSTSEGAGTVQIVSEQNTITFDAAGRVTNAANPPIDIDFSNTAGGACAPTGNMRCMRIVVTIGGQVRMCVPSLPSTDTRAC